MPLITLGINHNTAPVEIREKVAINRLEYSERVEQLMGLDGVEEAIILGTCNRTEIYCLCANQGTQPLLEWVHQSNGLEEGELSSYFYTHIGEDAVKHLIRVACGLDSLVLGEPQILGQLKEAWHLAQQSGGAGKILDRLFQHTFSAAKTIRNQSGVGTHSVSVAYTAVILARQLFGDLSQQNVVLLGAGEMIRLCGQHLKEQGIARLEIVNRSLEAGAELANELGARSTALEDLADVLPRSDILISSTASPTAIINRNAVKTALKKRRQRPMFMVDIAVPRDIDPEVSTLDGVYLFTIDDLQQVVDQNKEHRHNAAQSASQDVDRSAETFMRWLYGLRAARSLKRIRSMSHDHENALVEKSLNRLQAGQDPEQVLTQLANTLTNRILHEPTQRIREAAEDQQYEILKAADWIFRGKEELNEK